MVRVVVNVYRKQFVYGCRLLFTIRNIAIIILVICESRHATNETADCRPRCDRISRHSWVIHRVAAVWCGPIARHQRPERLPCAPPPVSRRSPSEQSYARVYRRAMGPEATVRPLCLLALVGGVQGRDGTARQAAARRRSRVESRRSKVKRRLSLVLWLSIVLTTHNKQLAADFIAAE